MSEPNEMEELEHYGQQLRIFRKYFGISQSELAEWLDVHLNTISKWEKTGEGLSDLKYRSCVNRFSTRLLKEKGIVFEEHFGRADLLKGIRSIIERFWGAES